MKTPAKFAAVLFVLLAALQQSTASADFDIDSCSLTSIKYNLRPAGLYRLVLGGRCGYSHSFQVLYYYFPQANSPDKIREVLKVSTLGYSTIVAACDGDPVLAMALCSWFGIADPTGTIHDKYRKLLTRDLLTADQLADLNALINPSIQQSLAQQSRASKATVMPGPEAFQKAPTKVVAVPFTAVEAKDLQFTVSSPIDGGTYPAAPPLEFTVPERSDVMYHLNKCKVPLGDEQCEQFETTILARDLHCNEAETVCRFNGALGMSMNANMHYMLFVRPVPLKYKPAIIEFDMSSIARKQDLTRKASIKQ